jgi:AMP-polyphosphate phosphotransferase
MRARLAEPKPEAPVVDQIPERVQPIDDRGLIETMDLTLEIKKHDYEKKLDEYQGTLARLTRLPKFKKRAVVAVFEGADAAGKGGAIRRVCAGLDARNYRVIPIAAPTDEEKARPYLWRFWRQLPRKGKMTIFDRSWYGRVLVERVEGYCSVDDWKRAYGEINAFEEELERSGCVVVKFWLQISKEEQLQRFEARQATPFKQFKIGPEDWRNREKWDQYREAVNEMVERTSTDFARWTLVEANDKRFARIKILETLCREIEKVL